MEVTNSEAATFDETSEKQERPAFLSVICVLSFIGIGIMIILSLLNVKSAFMSPDEMAAEMITKFESIAEMNPEAAGMLNEDVLSSLAEAQKYGKVNWIIGIVGNLLSLLACIMMWKLRKAGFYIYIGAELIPFFISMFFLGSIKALNASMMMMGMGDDKGNVIVGVMVFFDLLFIVLYALNLKSMK